MNQILWALASDSKSF